MSPFQGKPGFIVIEVHFCPGIYTVAGCAVVFRVIFRIDKGLMDILVAIVAPEPDVPEFPPVLFLMTIKTGCSQMGAFEFEN